MAVFSVVKLSELEGAKRLDAEYYKPEYLDLEKKIKNKKWDYLGNLVIFNRRGIQPKYSSTTTKYRAVVSQNISEDFLDVSNLPFVEENFFNSKQAQEVKIKPFDILIYTTGANIGRTNIFYAETIEAIASNHVNIIRIDSSKINPLYIGVFLQSKIGRTWSDRWASGSAQEEIYPEDFEKFPLLIPCNKFQNDIANLVLKSFRLIEDSNNLYSQAENLLLEELGLKDFKPKYQKTYTAKLSDAFTAHRMDAEYFQPAYEEVIEKIKKYPNGFSKLLKHAKNVPPDFDPTKYPERTFSYVELANIDSSIGIIHSVNEIKGEEAPSRARRMLKENDVIVSSVEGSLEKVALVDKEHDGCLASTGFFQFRPIDILPEVLLVLSKTIVLQSQLKKKCSGTILTAVPKESLRDIIIPLLLLPIQQEIASLVQKSHEAKKKAKELLEVAKRAVEIAIEKNEKEALEFIDLRDEVP